MPHTEDEGTTPEKKIDGARLREIANDAGNHLEELRGSILSTAPTNAEQLVAFVNDKKNTMFWLPDAEQPGSDFFKLISNEDFKQAYFQLDFMGKIKLFDFFREDIVNHLTPEVMVDAISLFQQALLNELLDDTYTKISTENPEFNAYLREILRAVQGELVGHEITDAINALRPGHGGQPTTETNPSQ